MFWEKIRGNPKIGDIQHKDNRTVNMIVVVGIVVTLVVCVIFLLFQYGLL